MASVSRSANGLTKIQFADGSGKRPIVRLGRIPKKKADAVCAKIESILEAKLSRSSLDNETARWLGEIPDVLHKWLAAVGLVAPRKKRQEGATKLGEFIDAYIIHYRACRFESEYRRTTTTGSKESG